MTSRAPPAYRYAPYRPLGAFRLVLASLVMIQHAGSLLPLGIGDSLGPLEVGSIAVFCFFTVSGLVITEAAMAFYETRPAAFLGNRLLRLFPTYIAALCVSALILVLAAPAFVAAINESPIPPERYATSTVVINLLAMFPIWKMVQSHLQVPEILEQGWALRIEFVFYLAVAACLVVGRFTRFRASAALTGLGLVALLGITVVGQRVAGTTLENAPYFVLGVALYFGGTPGRERWVAGAFCVTACLFIVAHLLGRPPAFGVANFPRDRMGELLLLAGLLAVMILLGMGQSGGGGRWTTAMIWDRRLGEITYPLYLMHWAVLVAGKAWLPHHSWLSTTVSFAAAFGLAAVTVVLIESPVARLRAKLRGRSPSPGAAPSTRPASAFP